MTQTSKEYSTALFSLAKETNSTKEFLDALYLISEKFAENPEYVSLLSSPNIPLNERNNLLEKAFQNSIPEYVLSFTQLLCENKHLSDFNQIIYEYEQIYKTYSSVSDARIVSTIPLTENEKNTLIKNLEKKSGNTVHAKFEIDKTLLAGIVIYLNDTVIDGSLKHKLKEIKEVINQ